ncbi:MAG: ATP-dependent metallopeptidase FtsH/Yme1/Tma family protein, partial [Pseudomonadota bacterium]|nr:ATP-dependent metallopeptidase FtsH/Yme1/Tma family protein [Pseudomonadota bacterium]
MNDMAKNLVLWLVIAAVLLTVFNNFNPQSSQESLTYSEFVKEVQSDQIREVTIDGLIIVGMRHDNSRVEA